MWLKSGRGKNVDNKKIILLIFIPLIFSPFFYSADFFALTLEGPYHLRSKGPHQF